MHSSYKSIGSVDGGPEVVLDALVEVLGPQGTLMVPTHTYNFCYWMVEPYDSHLTASRVGLLTELVRKRPRAVRSRHPTHSVAAIGAYADYLVENHIHGSPLGMNSPWDRLRLAGGDVLMLGTGLDTCTILHLAECLAEVPYLDTTFVPGESTMSAFYINERGIKTYIRVEEVPGCSVNFTAAQPFLERDGLLKAGRVGQAKAYLMPAQSGVDCVVKALLENPALLLCRRPECQICPQRREAMLLK